MIDRIAEDSIFGHGRVSLLLSSIYRYEDYTHSRGFKNSEVSFSSSLPFSGCQS